jgi:DNA-binding MarR family transcriptional regulator
VGIGPLLRFGLDELRSRIYAGAVEAGFGDLRPTHVTLFRWPGPDGRRPTQVAEDTQISKQRVRDLLRDLERLGYLELEADPEDGRARLIRLTERGRRLHAATLRTQSEIERDWAERVGRERFRILMETLAELVRIPAPGRPRDEDGTR